MLIFLLWERKILVPALILINSISNLPEARKSNKCYNLSIMKYLTLILLLATNFILAAQYEKIIFKRAGGGNHYFEVKLDQSNNILVHSTKYYFKPVSRNCTISAKQKNAQKYINLINKITKKNYSIFGKKTPETGLTGTWLTMYVVDKAGNETEITREKLIDELKGLEKLVNTAYQFQNN